MSQQKRREMQEAMTANLAEEQAGIDTGVANSVNPANVAEAIGNPNSLHMIYAASLLASIPEPVSDALAMEKGSKALMFALVLDSDTKVRAHELEILRETTHADLESEILRLVDQLDKLHARYRLPLFDLAIPTLKSMQKDQQLLMVESVKSVINADRKIKLEELTIYILLRAHLGSRAGQADLVRYKQGSTLKKEIALLLSLLAHLGKSESHTPKMVFEKSASELEAILPDLEMIELKQFNPDELVAAMEKFSEMSPALKERLTAASIQAVMADDKVSIKELEVMRGLCASMDVPVPPVLVD